jgi:antibiotic biosynthesis monooxygenase (ABM) superfamily enzyme
MKPPVKYKMASLIWCAIYPTINLLFFIFNGILAPYPMYTERKVVFGFKERSKIYPPQYFRQNEALDLLNF